MNSNGDVGIALFHMGGAQKPAYIVGIHDALTPGSSFDFSTVKTSTNGPNLTDQWGDFVRVKPYKPDNGKWVASGFTLQGGSDASHIQILYEIFGRQAASSSLTFSESLGISNIINNPKSFCGKTIDQFDSVINSTLGNDILSGTNGNDLILGNDGNYRIFGNAGNDCIIVGTGSSYISGGAGDDIVIKNGPGDSKIWGGADNDTINGGSGNDRIVGGTGNDILNGNGGDDFVWGQAGNDTIDGGSGFDTCIDYLGTNTATSCEKYYQP